MASLRLGRRLAAVNQARPPLFLRTATEFARGKAGTSTAVFPLDLAHRRGGQSKSEPSPTRLGACRSRLRFARRGGGDRNTFRASILGDARVPAPPASSHPRRRCVRLLEGPGSPDGPPA